jgi:putative ABC transport system permease protein
LPRLRRKVKWPETNFTVILVGVGDEFVLDTSTGSSEPLTEAIPEGHCVVGYELHTALGIARGETISLLGRQFIVDRCEEELGTKKDITLWLKLTDVQQLLELPRQINEILLLEHLEVWGRLTKVREQLAGLMPDCQVVEMASQTTSRAHAHVKVAEEAEAAVAQERQRQALLEQERQRVVVVFLPICGLVAAMWVAILMHANVSARAREIGIMLAQGFHIRSIQKLFLSKALLLGVLGGLTGYVGGAIAASGWHFFRAGLAPPVTFDAGDLGLALAMSVAACLLGTWIPTWCASRLDAAIILRQE